jgi:hypothetical protein
MLSFVIRAVATCLEDGETTATWVSTMPSITTNHVFKLDDLLSIRFKCSETNATNPKIYAFRIFLEDKCRQCTDDNQFVSRIVYDGQTYARNLTKPIREIVQLGFVVPSYVLRPREDKKSMQLRLEMQQTSKKITALSPPFDVWKDPSKGLGDMEQRKYMPDAMFKERGDTTMYHDDDDDDMVSESSHHTVSAFFDMNLASKDLYSFKVVFS